MPCGLFDKDLSNWLVRIPQWLVERLVLCFFPDEVIACHTALLPPAPGQRQIFFFFSKTFDMLVCLWRFLLCLCWRDEKRALTFAWPVSPHWFCVCRQARRCVCGCLFSLHIHTHIHIAHTHIRTQLNYDVTKIGSLLWHPACRLTQQTDLKELISCL